MGISKMWSEKGSRSEMRKEDAVKRLEMRAKHPLAIRWCHWVNFPLLALMI
jgi:hypothetical protein